MKDVIAHLKDCSLNTLLEAFKSKGMYILNIEDKIIEIEKEDIIIDEIALNNF